MDALSEDFLRFEEETQQENEQEEDQVKQTKQQKQQKQQKKQQSKKKDLAAQVKKRIEPAFKLDSKYLVNTQLPTVLDNIEALPAAPIGRQKKPKQLPWWEIQKTVVTPEIQRDVKALFMREYIDPKRRYTKMKEKDVPDAFQIGRVLEDPYTIHNRLTKKKRKATFLEELLDDGGQEVLKKRLKKAKLKPWQLKDKDLPKLKRKKKKKKKNNNKEQKTEE